MPATENLNSITGTVSGIVYQNEENGYTVLRLETQERGEITVVGCMPELAPGESLELQGAWGRHPAYGEQFKADVVVRRLPQGEKAIFEFLASGAVKGIGAATARRMLDRFGENTLNVLEQTPEMLSELPGISLKRAKNIGETYRRQIGMRRLLDFLGEHSLPLPAAMPLYRRYGDRALDAVKDQPYLLVDPDLGVDFSSADKLALELGLEADDPRRVEAAVLFELSHNAGNGHTFVPQDKLSLITASLLHIEPEPVEQAILSLAEQGSVVRQELAGLEACYLAELHDAEEYVAMRLSEMCQMELLPPRGLDKLIDRLEREQDITYADQQRRAVELAAKRQVILLTGGPGTGKTTCLRGVLALFEALGLETALAAPTGRAAKRLGEATLSDAKTIHRLLETKVNPSTGQLMFVHDQNDPLSADAVIVDETSMVDISLMSALLAALREDCRLVLVGDPDQLPSVGPGALLSDLLRCGRIPAVHLTQIFRQAQESAIVMYAHQIDQGLLPNLTANDKDFFCMRRYDSTRAVDTVVELCKTRLPKNMGIPAEQIQVLTPTRKRGAGSAVLNRAIQAAVNPPSKEKGERPFGEYIFRLGDRVMQIRNNYDVLWENPETGEQDMGVFNGDIGVIEGVNVGEAALVVNYDGRVVEYTGDMLNELEPAYAVTVHKAQGSEYRAVILVVSDVPPSLLTRGVLYTAITRARELLVLVGDDRLVARMVTNNRQDRRYSGLRARLAGND